MSTIDHTKDYAGNNITYKVYDLEVANDLAVANDIEVAGDLEVAGDITLTGGIAVAGDLEANGALKVLASGEYTTTGGNVVEVATIASKGINAGDHVIASVKDDGTSDVTLLTAEVTDADEITFTFSADPVADTIVSYLVIGA